jgi:hypothetical protein
MVGDSIMPCSVVRDWSSRLIPSRIISLIYIDFDELERIHVCSCGSERALRQLPVPSPNWTTLKAATPWSMCFCKCYNPKGANSEDR